MPYCPKCKAEYQEGIKECADCHVPLVDKLEEVSSSEKVSETQDLPDIVEVYRTLDEKDMEQKAFHLYKNGIKYSVFEYVQPIREELEVIDSQIIFRLLVSEEDAPNAVKLIEEMEEKGIVYSDEELSKIEREDTEWRCSNCGAPLDSPKDICEKCMKELGKVECSNCGYLMDADDEVCPKCGKY
jgi:predicted amidophosphoribosyltransferase